MGPSKSQTQHSPAYFIVAIQLHVAPSFSFLRDHRAPLNQRMVREKSRTHLVAVWALTLAGPTL